LERGIHGWTSAYEKFVNTLNVKSARLKDKRRRIVRENAKFRWYYMDLEGGEKRQSNGRLKALKGQKRRHPQPQGRDSKKDSDETRSAENS